MSDIFIVSKKVVEILKEELLYHTGGGEADWKQIQKDIVKVDNAFEEKITKEIIKEAVVEDYIPEFKETELLFDLTDIRNIFQKLKEALE